MSDKSGGNVRKYSLDEVKAAFFAEFHQCGELFFSYLDTPEENKASTDLAWSEFALHLDASKKYEVNPPADGSLIRLVAKLRAHFAPDGDYAITRADRENLGIGDMLIVGDILEKIDKIIDSNPPADGSLLPCPFCGGEPGPADAGYQSIRTDTWKGGGVHVGCKNDDCPIYGVVFGLHEWMTRRGAR